MDEIIHILGKLYLNLFSYTFFYYFSTFKN